MVLFYLEATDKSSFSARTLVIHKEKSDVLLKGDDHSNLFNFPKHLKTFTGLAEIAESKGLEGKPMRHNIHTVLFHHTEVQKTIILFL